MHLWDDFRHDCVPAPPALDPPTGFTSVGLAATASPARDPPTGLPTLLA